MVERFCTKKFTSAVRKRKDSRNRKSINNSRWMLTESQFVIIFGKAIAEPKTTGKVSIRLQNPFVINVLKVFFTGLTGVTLRWRQRTQKTTEKVSIASGRIRIKGVWRSSAEWWRIQAGRLELNANRFLFWLPYSRRRTTGVRKSKLCA